MKSHGNKSWEAGLNITQSKQDMTGDKALQKGRGDPQWSKKQRGRDTIARSKVIAQAVLTTFKKGNVLWSGVGFAGQRLDTTDNTMSGNEAQECALLCCPI